MGVTTLTKGGGNLFADPSVVQMIKDRPMLQGLDRLVYMHVRDAIKKVEGLVPQHNPFLYEPLLTAASKLLDRCLASRRECLGLEAQAVQRALEYQLFADLASDEGALTNAMTDTAALDLQATGQQRAAAEFSKYTHSVGTAPFAEVYAAGSGASSAASAIERTKRTILVNRLTKLKKHQELLESRHTTSGHALNYIERRSRTIELLVQDVVEAYQKARSARAGMREQLGVDDSAEYPFPATTGDEQDVVFLDQLVLWVRETVRRYELATKDEVAFELVLPLSQPYGPVGPPAGVGTNDKVEIPEYSTLVNPVLFASAMQGDGIVVVTDINRAIIQQFKRVRLRGLAISVAWAEADGAKHTDPAMRSWSARVVLPSQLNPLSAEFPHVGPQFVERSPVVLGNVGYFSSGNPPRFSTGDEVWNAEILNGPVQIEVDPLVVRTEAGYAGQRDSQELADKPMFSGMNDIKLHLRLVAVPA